MEEYDLILIKGRTRSGKSTLAKKLSDKYEIPILETDLLGTRPIIDAKTVQKPLIIVSQSFIEIKNTDDAKVLEIYTQPGYTYITCPDVKLTN